MPPDSPTVLGDLCFFVKETCDCSFADSDTYVSTESMLPNIAGITASGSIPLTGLVNKYRQKDILISNIRPYFKKIWQSDRCGTCSNDVLVLRAKDERISDYLFALLSEDCFFDYVMLGSKGTKMPRGDKNQILTYPINKQTFSEMLAIGNFISLIKRKVTCNQAINDNLLEIGKQLFNDMLSNSNLSSGKLSDITNITMGQSPPGESLSEKQNGMIFYQGRSEFGKIFPTPRLHTSDPKRIAPKGSVLVSVRAPVGDINLALNECCIGRGLAAIETKNSTPGFVHYLIDCLQPAFDIFNGNGTVFGSIDKISINNLEINIPDESSLKSFDEKAKTIDSLIETNHVEMMKLIELRDCLLPKLMSGVVDVSNLDLPTKYSFGRLLGYVLLVCILHIFLIDHGIMKRRIDPYMA